jgi:hypothetical protein
LNLEIVWDATFDDSNEQRARVIDPQALVAATLELPLDAGS